MKQIEFSEEQLGNMDAIAAQLFSDSDDPRSYNYKRKLVRPKIHWLKIILVAVLTIGSSFGMFFLLSWLEVGLKFAVIASIAFFVAMVLLLLKRILICLVHIYQRFAPDSVRNRCRFEPSCSEYMILSLQKYGLFKGLGKGIKRLRRCNIHNGGYDYP